MRDCVGRAPSGYADHALLALTKGCTLIQEIVPDLRLGVVSEPHAYNFNGYLVSHPEGNLDVDPVRPGEAELPNRADGVSRILLTDRNHSRAAIVVRAHMAGKTRIHADDATHAKTQGAAIDGELAEGERIGILTIIAVPVRPPGEVALHWLERRLFIVAMR